MFNAANKALIWTIALAIPFQGLSASSCGCVASREALGTSTCCHRSIERAASCCCGRGAGHGCCSGEHHEAKTCCCCGKAKSGCQHCTCSLDCPCRQAKQLPPTAPPIEQRLLDKVRTLDLATVSTEVVAPTANSQQSILTLASCDALGGADRCISLCRYRL